MQNPRTAPTSQISLARRNFCHALALTPLVLTLAACTRGAGPSEPLPSVDFAEFPQGLGRGYPRATLDGIQRPGNLGGVGSPAPNFRLQLDDERGLYLHDLRGHPVMLNFWATWCGPCRLEMPDIVRHARTNEDLIIIAVNVQEPLEPIAAFAGDFRMELPVARDEDGKVRDLYAVRGMPTSVFIDRAGNIASVYAGALSPTKLNELLDEIVQPA